MFPIRWLLVFTILVIRNLTEASVAEEINFEVSNMRELAKNDAQIQQWDRTEYDQEDPNNTNEPEDVEMSQSEIVETHVLPEETTPEEVNVQMKRPRRRRRRRRRKRPKPANTEDVDTYFSAPEEEVKRKPTKYRLPEANEELPQETLNVPRRRNVKRRRRPHKRPIPDDVMLNAENISENRNITNEKAPNYLENGQTTDHQDTFKLQDVTERIKSQSEYHPEKITLDTSRRPITHETEITKSMKVEISSIYTPNKEELFTPNDGPKIFPKENRFPKTLTQEQNYKVPPRTKEPEQIKTTQSEEQINRAPHNAFIFSQLVNQEEDTSNNPRRRKRPSVKAKNITETDIEMHEPELLNAETNGYNHNFRKQENKVNLNESSKIKIEDIDIRTNDTSKKDVYKIRRLPPTSAILRQIRIRPLKNSMQTKIEIQNKTEENFINEIATINESSSVRTDLHDFPHLLPTNIPYDEDRDQFTTEKSPSDVKADPGLFETKSTESVKPFNYHTSTTISFSQLSTTISTSTTSKATSTSRPSTTENTAFIYIPCNQTLDEMLKQKLNLNNNNRTTFIGKSNDHSLANNSKPAINQPQNKAPHVPKSTSMEELEKLFNKVEHDTSTVASSTNIPRDTHTVQNQKQQNNDITESHEKEYRWNHQFWNNNPPKTRIFQPATDLETKITTENYSREPKWYQDYTKSQKDSKLNRKHETPFVKPSLNDDDLVLLYTSTSNPNLVFNEIDADNLEYSLHLRNNTFPRKYFQESLVHRSKNHAERKKLPLAVKSAIIISGAILALAVLGFFALLLSCKIRQAKSRLKCHRELYRENFQNNEFRQSSRSTSPVMSKSHYSGRTFSNNIQPNMASNRNYYLWQTLRKTFQYD